jgi:hypothetical protein
MAFAHLKRETLSRIKQAFADTDKVYDEELRRLMLERTEYTANLHIYKTPAYQLSGDISALNAVEYLADRTVPFKAWLENGKEIFTPLPQSQIFEDAIGELTAGPANPASAKTIVAGLEALSDLIESDEFAHEAVLFYRRIFETAVKEFEIVADYKSMHDALHRLQLGWPDMSAMLKNVESNSAIQLQVVSSSSLFTGMITDLDTTYQRRFVDASEKTWIDNLKREQADLERATVDDDMDAIDVIFKDIREQIGNNLTWLNNRLKASVTALHLKDLMNSMTDLCTILEEIASGRASQQVEKYSAGVSEMAKLDEEISKLIIQHDAWQRIEDFLRTLGVALGQWTDSEGVRSTSTEELRLGQLNLILNVIKMKVVPLLAEQTSMLAKKLNTSAAKLEELIQQKEADKAEDRFYTIRDQVRLFFFDLDSGLKAKCEELRRIGTRLREVNAELMKAPQEA